MLLPIGDSPNPPGRPYVTWTLIALNVLVYVALLPAHFVAADPYTPEAQEYLHTLAVERGIQPRVVRMIDLVHFEHGVKPGDFSVLDGLTSMFLHGSLMHLLGNMLFLWIYGDNVEHRLGRFPFLLAYFGTGYAAVLGDAALRAGSSIPSIGASGAISGVLGFYFAFFPHNRVRMWAFLFPFFIGTLELPARFVLAMYVVLDNLLPLLLSGGAGGVSFGAHLGGFVAGAGAAYALGGGALGGMRRPEPESGTPDRHTLRSLSPAEKLALALDLERRGKARLALNAYHRLLAEHPLATERAAAHLGAARIWMRDRHSPAAAYQHLYAVLEEGAAAPEIAEARALLAQLRGTTRRMPRRFLD